MIKLLQLVGVLAFVLISTACSEGTEPPESGAVTETRMDDVDVIDGTISDDMVDVDAQSSEEETTEGGDATGTDDSEDAAEENSQ